VEQPSEHRYNRSQRSLHSTVQWNLATSGQNGGSKRLEVLSVPSGPTSASYMAAAMNLAWSEW
jgi:hypothetical protein